jgi:hypothetical protein
LPLSYLHRDEHDYRYTTNVVECPFDLFIERSMLTVTPSTYLIIPGKHARLDEDIKGIFNYVGGVTVSLLVSMKISKG